jgi:hypothetical protein
MQSPIIPHNFPPFYQTELIISGTDSTKNGSSRPPICAHEIEDSFSWPLLPHPVASHGECNFSQGSIPGPVARHIPCPHKDVPSVPLSPRDARLPADLRSSPVRPHHVAVPRSRLTTAGFHCRRRGGFAWSHFFPRSVGFAPTASRAKGALTIEPSILCHDQAIPSISSYSANPFRQRRINTPCRFHSKKYWWMELGLPKSFLDSAFHWQPVRRTYTMPSNTLRGSIGLRPPPGFRRYFRRFARFRIGIRGSTRFHNSSDMVHDLMALIAYL